MYRSTFTNNTIVRRKPIGRRLLLTALTPALVATTMLSSQQALAEEDRLTEEIVVTGIRSSLQSALNQKRNADNLIEVIEAQDIGKLPDQNLAEVLENITGIQITRVAGIGTNVQIRGTDANRVEFNGVSTVGSSGGRSGIDFEDVNSSIIKSVEVTKASEAKTIEGSVGGTVNLKTIRPLELSDTLASVRVQAESSSLSEQGVQPRFSGAFGDNWETNAGSFGVVISGSYTEQEAVSFRPRADRDNLSSVEGFGPPDEFLGIQFLLQEQENDEFETLNLAGTFEWAPNDNLTLFFDAFINDQERSRDQYRLQASGVSALRFDAPPSTFETVDFGSLGGEFAAALTGTLEPNLGVDDDDPNLRFTSETNSRVTDVRVYRFGGNWQGERWAASAEVALSDADTTTPSFNTTLNFINPNCPLDGAAAGDPDTSNDNCVPFIYDLSDDSLAFGINFASPFAPSVADLTNPANVVLDAVAIGQNTQDNSEDAFRVDFSYFVEQFGISSIDVGYRYNESTSTFEDIDANIGGFSRLEDSPNGTLFEELLVVGPDNFDDADGRDLAIRNFLLIDPNASFDDPEGTLAILEGALAAQRALEPGADGDLTAELESDPNAFFDVEEQTHSAYLQANFNYGIVSGNVGLRYVQTDVESIAFGPEDANGVRSLESTEGDYDFFLPRINVAIRPNDQFVIRASYGQDIRRPDFSQLNSGFTFDQSENAVVALGNPGLNPEEVDSFDIGVEWYFAPSAVLSVGYFNKERRDIFGIDFEGALLIPDANSTSGFVRETDPACPGGGIFNPEIIPNVLGDPATLGLCADFTIPGNDPDTTTQEGIEIAFQYDLSQFEDQLGWASGFGFVGNYTNQDFSGGSIVDSTSGRGLAVLGEQSLERGLLDFSENAFNATLYYEKYGLSARFRYTWREAFRTQDFGGGANTSGSSTFSFPVVTDDRGQLNASITYTLNDRYTFGVEAVNLTESEIVQNCVTGSGPTCFVGFPDRRIVFGVSARL